MHTDRRNGCHSGVGVGGGLVYRYLTPWIPPIPSPLYTLFRLETLPLYTLPLSVYPPPQKRHATSDLEGTWDQRPIPPPPSGETNTCENITFRCDR